MGNIWNERGDDNYYLITMGDYVNKAHPHDASYVYLRVDIASMERGTLIKHSELGNNNM